MINTTSPSVFETLNARHLSPTEVARSFVAPPDIFGDLLTKNNHILVGPRGSGKTTLLKMLTLPALTSWDSERFGDVRPEFMGVFVPVDRSWRAQLTVGEVHNEGADQEAGHIAFTTHVLTSLVQTLRDTRLFSEAGRAHWVPPALDARNEGLLTDELSSVWKLVPSVRSFAGLSIALKARLVELGGIRQRAATASDALSVIYEAAPYADLDFRSCVSHAIEAFGALSGRDDLTWALLFDEFELAPESIQRHVWASLRGQGETRIVHKLALAPYNGNFETRDADVDASPGNDFKVIDLWYPDKARGYDFATNLVRRIVENENLDGENLRGVFGGSEFGFPEADDLRPYESDGAVVAAFRRLSNSDPSFAAYLRRREVNLDAIPQMSEEERAEKVRKVRSIVIAREYFRRGDRKSQIRPAARSRKIRTIYTGYPTILALCEGNPRLLIGIISPLIRRLKGQGTIDKSDQARSIQQAANAFRSMLKTIPYKTDGAIEHRGLLRLLDEIGDFFFRKCTVDPFSPQPPLSFVVDSNVDGQTLGALGRALNAGAIIYVPDFQADPLVTSLKGKRFRLSYLLAAYYKLPIMLNTSVALSSILGRSILRSSGSQANQTDLFGEAD